jgi:fumarate hydratase class II
MAAAAAPAARGGAFELDAMTRLAARDALQAIEFLVPAAETFATRCVEGVRATPRRPELVERSPALVTALAAIIGYDAAAEIAPEAARAGRTVRKVARDKTSLSDDELDRPVDPPRITEPGRPSAPLRSGKGHGPSP